MRSKLITGLRILLVLAAALLLADPATRAADSAPVVIHGQVLGEDGQPLVGASVTLFFESRFVDGTATDDSGRYDLSCDGTRAHLVTLAVSSVGYEPITRAVRIDRDSLREDVVCTPKPIELPAVRVTPSPERELSSIEISSAVIRRSTARALVSTNPVAAVTCPQLAKVGSVHSSQLRIDGTSPCYYLDGAAIGADPDHYGMFSIVPASVVRQIDFYPQGTDVRYGLPSILDIRTTGEFVRARSGEISLSAIEATGSYRVGHERWFAVASIRKSILDKLIKQFEMSTERRAVPPTNFQDIFLSSGVRLSRHVNLAVDQYHVGDYLSYATTAPGHPDRVLGTYQHAWEHYASARLQVLHGGSLVEFTGAVKDGGREYAAWPDDLTRISAVNISLSEKTRTYTGSAQAEFQWARTRLRLGDQFERTALRSTEMQQRNWNLLPPFASSDNPFVYQSALNELYGEYRGDNPSEANAVYAGVEHRIGRFVLDNGIRYESFSPLAEGDRLVLRHRASMRVGTESQVELFHGTFAETPVSGVLEPYQVLVRASMQQLTPITTRLTSLSFSSGGVKVSVFDKRQDGLPVVAPDFADVYTDHGTLAPTFIRMRSEGSAQFRGMSTSLTADQLWHGRMSLYTSYAYSWAVRTDHGVTVPYDLNARHRLHVQWDYRPTRRLTVGTELQFREGYPYSKTRGLQLEREQWYYTEEAYRATLAKENSERLAANAVINLHGSLDFGRTELFASVANITNRANPIIHSASGFIYDVGILPSIGLRYRF